MDNVNFYSVFSLIAFAVVAFTLLKPVRIALKVILNCVLGAGAIIVSNAFFGFIGAGIILGVNVLNSAIVGLLGVPGLFALIVINKFFL